MSRIFLSYRRTDSRGYAGWLRHELVERFGETEVFLDVNAIPPGADFPEHIEREIGGCDVFVVLIGPSWLDARDDAGRRRIDNPKDYVHHEIAIALEREVMILPVLVGDAAMPPQESLPEPLRRLGRRNAFELGDRSWSHQVGELVGQLEIAIEKAERRREEEESRRDRERRPSPLQPGALITDAYTVDSLIGHGAYGDVYKVRPREALASQALKLIAVGPQTDRFDAFLQEARGLMSLSHHPHILPVLDAGVYESDIGPVPFFTMEYFAGKTLAERPPSRIRFDVDEALEAGAQMLSALAAAHALSPPVLHRDIEPGNVFIISEDPFVLKISDFGLARHVHPDTRLLRAVETLRYQPPEAARTNATEAGDLYSVALLLYELLTGVTAYPVSEDADLTTNEGVADALRRSRETLPPPPSTYRRGLPPPVDQLILSALAIRPESRFRTAMQFRAVLDDVRAAIRP
jgi:hypothetical protein